MEETQPVDGLVHELQGRRKQDRTRRIVYILVLLWLATLAALVVVAWNAYFHEKDKTLTLAEQVTIACESGVLRPGYDREPTMGLSVEERQVLCTNAKKVVEQNDPELQDDEIQESEIQDPEFQEPEIQNKEKQDPETQDPEAGDPEVQEPEIQDPETQDPEEQDPEKDDPDPNDPPKGATCTFDGSGTIIFTWETDNGTQTSTCTGTQEQPGPVVP